MSLNLQQIVHDVVSGDLLARQLTQVQTLHLGLVDGFSENPFATLGALAGILFALSFACRYLVYGIVRISGREKYDNRSRALENLWIMIAFSLGLVAGEVCFQNLWLSAMTGAGFAVISIGAVLEGLVSNERARRDRHSRGLKV